VPASPPPLRAAVASLEAASALDPVASAVSGGVRSALPAGVKSALHGDWLGHALHPLLTDLVIGTWTSALILDLAGGRHAQAAADRLLTAGVASYPPTALTGVADWSGAAAANPALRRVGLVHAASNAVALTLQLSSLRARRSGRRGRGVALSVAANATLGLAGYLGGHLTYVLGAGVEPQPAG
jgi:uncharacterized membrane protein